MQYDSHIGVMGTNRQRSKSALNGWLGWLPASPSGVKRGPTPRLWSNTLAMCCLATMVCVTALAHAAILPDHRPIRILIIADAVNPHRLSDAQLTQPEDLAPALSAADSPLHIASMTTVDSQCADDALQQLAASERPDVVLYFAHRAAAYCNGSSAQVELTQLLDSGLQQGLGLVVLHHGLYIDFRLPGAKDALLALIGARSNSIAWDTEQGQRVFNVGGEHFISSNGLHYAQHGELTGLASVPAASYPFFDNIPDELYADTVLLEQADETRTLLFATDSGGAHVLGYVLQRPSWRGRVVAYQPGEYQPNALDDHAGPNYQILMNSIYFAAFGP